MKTNTNLAPPLPHLESHGSCSIGPVDGTVVSIIEDQGSNAITMYVPKRNLMSPFASETEVYGEKAGVNTRQ